MAHPDIQPVRRRRLYQDILEQLENLIVTGELKPGTQLPPERELVERFGAGRTAVREALFALQKRGLITLNSGERAIVSAPSASVFVSELASAVRYFLSDASGVREFQAARVFFEVGLARQAAQLATEDDLNKLKEALAKNAGALGDHERFVDSDVAFHFILAEIARNSIFVILQNALSEWLRDQRSTSVEIAGSPEAAYQAHCRIYEAVKAHDPDAAEREMRAHLAQVTEFYWRATEEPKP